VGAGGINNDVPQIYSCKQLAASVPCK
jgi:hypothetical protein